MSTISSITGLASVPSLGKAAALTNSTGDASFGGMLESAIGKVDGTQQQASTAITDFLHGSGELHTVALAAQKAELTFDLAVQVRNKVVSAYQEIMKMQL